MGLIAAGTLTEASFLRLVQVSAALFIVGAVVCAVTITNQVASAEPLPCEVAALCRDRAGVQPALASGGAKQPTRESFAFYGGLSFTRVIGAAG